MKRLFSKKERAARWILLLTVILLILLLSVYLIKNSRDLEKDPYQIVMIPKVIDERNDFWKALIEGAQAGAKEYGVELSFRAADAEDNHEMQADILYQVAKEKPDAVILAPTSYTEVTDAAKEVTDAGIPLILVDSTLDEQLGKSLIATDNIEAGSKMAQCILENLPENPVIGVVAHVEGSSTAMEREAGLRIGLGSYEKHIVGIVFSDSDYDRGYEMTTKLLEEHPDINVLFGLNEYSAVGAARAVKDLNLTSQIQMIGFDSSVEEIQLLESGVFEGIVVQKPFNMGYLGVETAVQVLQGKDVAEYIDSGSQAVTKEAMYSEENQKLLFLFREKQN